MTRSCRLAQPPLLLIFPSLIHVYFLEHIQISRVLSVSWFRDVLYPILFLMTPFPILLASYVFRDWMMSLDTLTFPWLIAFMNWYAFSLDAKIRVSFCHDSLWALDFGNDLHLCPGNPSDSLWSPDGGGGFQPFSADRLVRCMRPTVVVVFNSIPAIRMIHCGRQTVDLLLTLSHAADFSGWTFEPSSPDTHRPGLDCTQHPSVNSVYLFLLFPAYSMLSKRSFVSIRGILFL